MQNRPKSVGGPLPGGPSITPHFWALGNSWSKSQIFSSALNLTRHSLPSMPISSSVRNYRSAARRRGRRSRYGRNRSYSVTGPWRSPAGYAKPGGPFRPPGTKLIRQPAPTKIHRFRRSYITNVPFTTDVTGVAPSISLGAALNLLPGFSSFQTLFDVYRIVSVTASIASTDGNTDDIASVVTRQFPTLLLANDVDDAGTVTTNQLLERDNVMVYRMGDLASNAITHEVPTFCTLDASGTGATNGSSPVQSPWLDIGDADDVAHGTTKMALIGTGATTYNFNVIFSVIVDCKYGR